MSKLLTASKHTKKWLNISWTGRTTVHTATLPESLLSAVDLSENVVLPSSDAMFVFALPKGVPQI